MAIPTYTTYNTCFSNPFGLISSHIALHLVLEYHVHVSYAVTVVVGVPWHAAESWRDDVVAVVAQDLTFSAAPLSDAVGRCSAGPRG